MGQPVGHFEIIGTDPGRLRGYHGELFGRQFATGGPVAETMSEAGDHGFTGSETIPGGVGGGAGYQPHTVFYAGVPDVEAALAKAGSLGGRRVTGPVAGHRPGRRHFTGPRATCSAWPTRPRSSRAACRPPPDSRVAALRGLDGPMPKVTVKAADYALFASCAAATGLTVDQWLTEAGRLRTSTVGVSRSLDEVWAATLQGPR